MAWPQQAAPYRQPPMPRVQPAWRACKPPQISCTFRQPLHALGALCLICMPRNARASPGHMFDTIVWTQQDAPPTPPPVLLHTVPEGQAMRCQGKSW
eukprot:1157637-Pelagomonas_calceolata.AAC.10